MQLMKMFTNIGYLVLHLFFVALAFAFGSFPSYEADQLLMFKQGLLKASSLKSWNSSIPLEKWEGVTTNSNNSIVELHLSEFQLKGQLWPFWCNLSSLVYLDLSQNGFTASPLSLNSCCSVFSSGLRFMNLSTNDLTGALPLCLRSDTLEYFDLSRNSFSGELPPNVGEFRMLRSLILTRNKFQGSLPSTIGKLVHLEHLELLSNNFSGHIPISLKGCRNLTYLNLGKNSFTGEMHLEGWDKLSYVYTSFNPLGGRLDSVIQGFYPTLRTLFLHENNLRGTIPVDLCQRMPQLQNLNIGRNMLTGIIPEALANCTLMEKLFLTTNRLTGKIPEHLFSRNLTAFSVGLNNLYGELSPSILNCTRLEYVHMQSNNFTGEIPGNLSRLTQLRYLNLGFNHFKGQMLPDVGDNLQILYLSGNMFSGELLQSRSSYSAIQELDLFSNQLGYKLPSWLGNFTGLLLVSLAENMFTGPIPPELGNLTDLGNTSSTRRLGDRCTVCASIVYGRYQWTFDQFRTQLDLRMNKLTGSIPSELGKLGRLQQLYLDGNQLSGAIPASLGDLTSLLELDLSNNKLSGQIPATLEKLTFLTIANFSNNMLTGSIPSHGQFITLNSTSFAGNPGLCGRPLDISCGLELLSPPNHVRNNGNDMRLAIVVGTIVGFTAGFWIAFAFLPNQCLYKFVITVYLYR